MASPITTLGTATVVPAASVTSPKAETVMNGQQTQTVAQPQDTLSGANLNVLQPTKDTVALSSAARDLSKELQDQKDKQTKQPAMSDQEVKRKLAEPVIQKPTDKPDISIIKNFPPFMGNTDALKQLKQVSPALYRQVLSMIVPPPANLSYTDLQYLQKPRIDAKI